MTGLLPKFECSIALQERLVSRQYPATGPLRCKMKHRIAEFPWICTSDEDICSFVVPVQEGAPQPGDPWLQLQGEGLGSRLQAHAQAHHLRVASRPSTAVMCTRPLLPSAAVRFLTPDACVPLRQSVIETFSRLSVT